MARTLLRRIATLVAVALLFTQLAVAAHACAGFDRAMSAAATPDAAPPDCHGGDTASPNLCAEHCKQGQSDRTSTAVAVPPVLLNALYEAAAVPEPPRHRPASGAWLSALVAASPPHAIAHCVLRI
jgi:hypothetical protein